MAHDVRRAVAARDAATARLRRVTAAAAAFGVGSTVLLAGLAAGSTHLRKTAPPRRPAATTARRPASPVRAPAPPLVAVASPPPAQPAAPPPAPAPAVQPPVAVSGGS